MNVIVTGASGFIGSNLVKSLVKDDKYKVISLIRPNSNSPHIRNLCDLVECDIFDKDLKNKVKQNVDIVIHLAVIKQYYKSQELIYKTNVEGTKNILECFKDVKHFIFISTVVENPQTHYAKSKLECEKIIKKSEINYTILRPSPVFGFEDNTNISKIIKLINAEKHFPIPSNGNVEIQPIHVDDVVNAIKTIMMNKDFFNKTCNIVGKTILFNDLILKICKTLNKENKSFYVPIRFLKFIVLIYQNISSAPLVTIDQLNNLIYASKHLMKSDFTTTPLEISIKKCV